MVIAETKRQMHETLEMKEEEIAQLRSRHQQAVGQKEELQEQKEKAEKSGEWTPLPPWMFIENLLQDVLIISLSLQHLKNLKGLWVLLRGQRRPESNYRLSWRSELRRSKQPVRKRENLCRRNSQKSNRKLLLS